MTTSTPSTAETADIQVDFDIHDPKQVETVYERYAELRTPARSPIRTSTAATGS